MALSARGEAEAVLAAHRDKLTEGEKWALIEQKWLDAWIKYTGLNFDTGAIDNSKATGSRPGPIDNTRLAADDNHQILRMGVQENEDFGVITDAAWDLLHSWYGGGPVFKRTVITVGIRKTARLELFPYFVSLVDASDDGTVSTSVPRLLPFGPKATAQNVLDTANGVATTTTSDGDGNEGETSTAAATSRLWIWQEPAEVKEAPKAAPKDTNVASLDTDDDSSNQSSGPNSPSNGEGSDASRVAEVADSLNLTRINDANKGEVASSPATSEGVASSEPGTTTTEGSPAVPEKKKRLQDGYTLIEGKKQMEMQLEAIGASRTSAVKMLIERQRADGTWPRAAYVKDWRDFEVNDVIDACDTVKKWYASIIRSVKPGQVKVHFIDWADTWDEWMPVDSDRLAPKGTHASSSKSSTNYRSSWNSNNEGRPSTSGAVGLINLGNTCFMNSTLACLGHSPLLMDYFLDDTYLSKINRDNPLGWKGRVADEYGGLVKEVWSDKYTAVSPTAFKDAIGQFAPRFSGYQQQDSSELLSFLLDGLHEDLNQVKKKPFTPSVDSNGREDHVVANESWESHLKRNQSIIVDLMQGQLKSRLECPIPECKKVSVTFDPFMFLSVPLPTVADKVQDCVVMWADRTRRPVSYGVTVSAVGRMSDFKKALSDLSGIPANRLAAADLWNGRVYKMLDDETSMSEIRANDHLYCYEMLAHDFEVKDGLMQMAVFHQKVIRDPHYDSRWSHSKEYTTDPVGLAHVVMVPRRQHLTNREVRALVRRAVVHQIPAEADLKSPELKLVVMDGDGRYCAKHGYLGKCVGCELPDDDEKFEAGDGRECNVSIAVQWANPKNYNGSLDAEEKGASGTAETKDSLVRLSDCIKSFAKLEVLGAEDPWRCPACKDFRQASKKMDIWKLPDLLVIHLKRFSYTRTWRDKIDTFVDFPINGLDMSEFCVNPEFKGEKSLYDLYGVSNHYGGMGGGHYTAYVRNLTSGQWFNHDDSRVSPVRNINEIKSDAAYVLFYVRRGHAPWHKTSTGGVATLEDATVQAPRGDGITISADRGGNSTTLYRGAGSTTSSSTQQTSGSGDNMDIGDDIVTSTNNPGLLD